MASEAINEIRMSLGMEPEPPYIVDLPYDAPQTPSEHVENAMAVLHNKAELGEITSEEASDAMHELDAMRAEWGDGWEDRYGPLPDFAK